MRLTGGDLELLVRRLGLPSVRSLRAQGIVSLVKEPFGPGGVFWRPRIRFRTKPHKQCPFLLNDVGADGVYRGLCSLHPQDKPLVCSLAPLSREVDDPGDGPISETWSLVPPVEGCPGIGRGEDVALEAPPDLKGRLDSEAVWMRQWIAVSSVQATEEDAWTALDQTFSRSE